MMSNYFKLFIFSIYIVSCGTINKNIGDEDNKLYYITFYATMLENDYPIIMSGISDSFDENSLSILNIEDFVNSFYIQSYYTPNLDLYDSYIDALKCLNKEKSYSSDTPDYKLLKTIKIKTEKDKYFINIDVNKIESGFSVIYYNTTDNSCIVSNSNELKIKEINSIKKIAMLKQQP